MRVELHPEARVEAREAARWYDGRQAELGRELLAELDQVLARMVDFPESFPRWRRTGRFGVIRKASLTRFPYLVPYRVEEDRLYVLAVAHASRRPLYWLGRAKDR